MRYILLLLFPAIIFSCNSTHSDQKQKSTFSIDSARAHIIKMNESYSERFMTNDTAYYISRYCKDAQVYSPGMPAVVGRDSIINFFYQNATNKEAKIELPAGNIYGNEELVVEEGTYNFPDGKGGSFDQGKFIAIWKQEDEVWKLFREIWNSDSLPKPFKE